MSVRGLLMIFISLARKQTDSVLYLETLFLECSLEIENVGCF